MGNEPIKLDAGDVRIEDRDPELCDKCDDRPATKIIMVDFRTIGTDIWFNGAEYCESCAEEVAAMIRAALPAKGDD